VSLRASPSRLRGTPARETCEWDFVSDDALGCLRHRDSHSRIHLIRAWRARRLRELRDLGLLRGAALIESNGGTHAGRSPS
jgi:hypothetical protein